MSFKDVGLNLQMVKYHESNGQNNWGRGWETCMYIQ